MKPEKFDDPALLLLRELIDEVRLLRADLAGRASPPDTAAFLLAIHNEIGDIAFNCFDLTERGALSAELGAAINQRVPGANARKLGRLFRQIEGVLYDGLILRCIGSERDGLIWKVARV